MLEITTSSTFLTLFAPLGQPLEGSSFSWSRSLLKEFEWDSRLGWLGLAPASCEKFGG
jgi:hypothetical protein